MARLEATLTTRLETVDRDVRAFAPAAVSIAELRIRYEELDSTLEERVTDFKEWIGDVERRLVDRLDGLRGEVGGRIDEISRAIDVASADVAAQGKQRAEARTRVILAVIAGCATVMAAVVAAVAAIASHA